MKHDSIRRVATYGLGLGLAFTLSHGIVAPLNTPTVAFAAELENVVGGG